MQVPAALGELPEPLKNPSTFLAASPGLAGSPWIPGPAPAGLAHTCTAPASQNAPCLAPIPAEPDPTSFMVLHCASTTCWKEGRRVGGQLPLLSWRGQHSTLLSAFLSPDTLPVPGSSRWNCGADGRTPRGSKGMSCSALAVLAQPAGGAAQPKPSKAVSFLAAQSAGRGAGWKWELSAAVELPTAALGIVRCVSCQHKGTCPCKQPVREQQTPGEVMVLCLKTTTCSSVAPANRETQPWAGRRGFGSCWPLLSELWHS